MQRTVTAVFQTFVGRWHSKQHLHHLVSHVELHKGRVDLLGATIVLVSGWRFIIIPFSAQSTCHRGKIHKHMPHGRGIQDNDKVTNYTKQFTIDETSFICKYEMKWRLFNVLVCFPKLYLQKIRGAYLNIFDVFSLTCSKIPVDLFLINVLTFIFCLLLTVRAHTHACTPHTSLSLLKML